MKRCLATNILWTLIKTCLGSLVVFLLLRTQALAYEELPEYRGVGGYEYLELQGSDKIDSEYQSDFLTFRKPFRWHLDFIQPKNIFDFSAGSVSSKRFITNHRLKIDKKLTDKLGFIWRYVDQSHLVEENAAHIIGLNYKIGDHFIIGAHGEVESRKSEDDFGLSLEHMGVWNIKLFVNFPDFSRNKRTEGQERFNKTPMSYGLVARNFNSQTEEFSEWAVRRDSPSEREFLMESYSYIYEKKYVGGRERKQLSRDVWINGEISHELRTEEVVSIPTSAVANQKVEFRESLLFVNLESKRPAVVYFDRGISGGVEIVERRWAIDEKRILQKSWLPHVWLFRQVKKDVVLGLGLETTVYRSEGDKGLRAQTDKDRASEWRANADFSFTFGESKMRWLLTFDLDRFGTGDTWEGGSGQFFTTF